MCKLRPRYDATQIHNLCISCQRPLSVRYDLAALKGRFQKALFRTPADLWRYLKCCLSVIRPTSCR